MRKLIFCFGLLLFTVGNTFGQTENLNRLMRERQEIIKEYEFYNAQNNNFWGKKSKKDLLRIVDALKGIINKDSEIINEVNNLNLNNLKKQAEITVQKQQIENQVVDDKRVVTDNFYDLKNQIQALQNKQKLNLRQVKVMEEKVEEHEKRNLELQKIVAIGGVVLLGLITYIFNLRRKISTKHRKA